MLQISLKYAIDSDHYDVSQRFSDDQLTGGVENGGHPLVLQYEKVHGKSAVEFAEYFHLTLKPGIDYTIDWRSAPEPLAEHADLPLAWMRKVRQLNL